ncbi:MAG: HD domain-containing protein [Erysipelotrichaceae bacterium]
MQDSILIHHAMQIATQVHHNHFLYDTQIPYVMHPFEVAQILTAQKVAPHVILAALLHDVMSADAKQHHDPLHPLLQWTQLRAMFGEEPLNLVSSIPCFSFFQSNQKVLHDLQHSSDVHLYELACGEHIAHLRWFKQELEKQPSTLYERLHTFGIEKNDLSVYFFELLERLRTQLPHHDMMHELIGLIDELFAQYYVQDELHILVKQVGHHCITLTQGQKEWKPQNIHSFSSMRPLTYLQAKAWELEFGAHPVFQKYTEFSYPTPSIDRETTVQEPLGFMEGFFSDRRPFLVELFQDRGIMIATMIFSAVDFLADALSAPNLSLEGRYLQEIIDYLAQEGIVYFHNDMQKEATQAGLLLDANHMKMIVFNCMLMMNGEPHIECSLNFWDFKTSGSVESTKSGSSYS